MSYEYVNFEKQGDIAIITMNRPERLNALGGEVLAGVEAAVKEVEDDPEIGAAIITGEGERSFSSGADLKNPMTHSAESTAGSADSPSDPTAGSTDSPKDRSALCESLQEMKKPIIAAINGYCIGGGLELALDCDIMICSENASFQLTQTNLGIIPGYAGPHLVRRIGKSQAMEMVLTAAMIDAREALRIGLVNKVVPIKELMPAAIKLAKSIAARAPLSVMLGKEVLNRSLETFLLDSLRQSLKICESLYDTDDRKEASRAFLEKREPRFTGR